MSRPLRICLVRPRSQPCEVDRYILSRHHRTGYVAGALTPSSRILFRANPLASLRIDSTKDNLSEQTKRARPSRYAFTSHHDRWQSKGRAEDDIPDCISVHPDPHHPYNSVAARPQNPMDSIESADGASLHVPSSMNQKAVLHSWTGIRSRPIFRFGSTLKA